jgi:hypothetical protein
VIYRLVITKIEGRLAVELSADLAQAMGVREGDAVYLTSPVDVRADAGREVELQEGLAAAEDAFRRYDSALRELAQ